MLQKFEETLEDAGEALKMDPKNSQALYWKGIALFYLADFVQAKGSLEESLLCDPAKATRSLWIRKCDAELSGSSLPLSKSDSSAWANWSKGSHRSRGDFGGGAENYVENYDIASNASYDSSNVSWWRADDRWSYGSWGESSNSSRENWAYVTRREWPGWDRSDPWHRWHEDKQGQVQPSGQGERNDGEQGEHPGDSEGEERPKGELPSGKVVSVHEKADKDEEKKVTGKLSTSYPPAFRARQGENYRDWKRSVRFWLHGEGHQLPTSLVGPRVMVQLRDRAAQLVKHLEPEHVDGKGGLEKIFTTLEKSPIVKLSEKHRVDWHRKRLLARAWRATSPEPDYIVTNFKAWMSHSRWVKDSLWGIFLITPV
eukprot:s430_g2.t1